MRRLLCTWSLLVPVVLIALCQTADAAKTGQPNLARQAGWSNIHDRVWVGPEYWANPMEDWRVAGGRLECTSRGRNRNLHILTRQLGKNKGTLQMSVQLGRIDGGKVRGSAGFRIGIRDEIDDFRARLIYGQGLDAGISTEGNLFVGEKTTKIEGVGRAIGDIRLQLVAEPVSDCYKITLSAHESKTARRLGTVIADDVAADRLVGNLALVTNYIRHGKARFWFNDWKISGTKVKSHDGHAFGPILWAMHTLSRNVMKMTAQMPPLGKKDSQTVRLQIDDSGRWKMIGEANIHPLARTATFCIEKWNAARDVPYRLAYAMTAKDGSKREHYFTGIVRKEPLDKQTIVVAGFTGNTDYGFPNREIVRNVGIHDPDVLFFSGDQIYESVGGYGIVRSPADRAVINYLRKWYLFGWAFRDLMRDRVTICLPDDHDVYQGNIWGAAGRNITMEEWRKKQGNMGGYVMHPDFVNAVHRTQTAHHPEPFDPTPIGQDISVYYGDMLYGRIGFAIIADRMFKSGPAAMLPKKKGRPDHIKDPSVNVKDLDVPNAKLLGDRQLEFLRSWAANYGGTDMKCVLSQTIFCNLANYHGPEKEFIIADLDSNGWPQTGRNRALHEMRRGFAFHLAGDQHLASIVHYGIDRQGDAGYSFCVPSIAAGYPRSWLPDKEGRPVKNRPEPGLPNTGDYLDGLSNCVRVYGIGNPAEKNRPGRINTLHDKASGYGLVYFNKKDHTITMECWRLLVDAADPKSGDQFPGWPKTIRAEDNYARQPVAYLPTVKVTGMSNPVVQVIDESNGETVYTFRILGDSFRPKVFKTGKYTIKVGEPSTKLMRMRKGINSLPSGTSAVLEFAM